VPRARRLEWHGGADGCVGVRVGGWVGCSSGARLEQPVWVALGHRRRRGMLAELQQASWGAKRRESRAREARGRIIGCISIGCSKCVGMT
jgi:hypothetical protein